MTIKTQTARHVVTANGSTTRFTFVFQTQSPADIYVGLETDIISVGFTVTVYPDQQTTPGGYVDFVTAPANGQRVTIMRWTIFTQEMFYSAYDPFPAKSHERALDTLAMQIQQIEDQVQRSYKVPWWSVDEEIPPPGGTAGDISFPPPKPGYTLVWNAAGTGFDNAPGENSFLQWVNEAEAAAASAAQSALSASNSATLSQKWAELMGAEVVPGSWSSKYWADKASKWSDYGAVIEDGRYSAKHWADVAAGLVGGSVNVITSSDIDMLDVSTPAYNERLLTLKSNRPLGMVKLTSAGVIPPEQLPASGINLLGPFRGDDLCPKYNDPVGACTEPDYRNPSQRWPDYVFHTGNSFIIIMEATQSSGHINVIDPATETYAPMEVFAGDGLIFFETDILDPADGVTVVIKAGWHVQPGWVKGGAVLAVNVMYDNTYSDWVGGNVQSVLDEISDRAALVDRTQYFTSDQFFSANIHIGNAKAIYVFDGINDLKTFYAFGIGDLGLGNALLSRVTLVTGAGGTAHLNDGLADYTLATREWVIAQGGAQLGVANTWTAFQTFAVGLAAFNGIYGVQIGGDIGSTRGVVSSDYTGGSDIPLYLSTYGNRQSHAGIVIFPNGYVGVGVNPAAPLDVYGDAWIRGTMNLGQDPGSAFVHGPSASGYLEIRTSGGTTDRGWTLGRKNNNGDRVIDIQSLDSTGVIGFHQNTVFYGPSTQLYAGIVTLSTGFRIDAGGYYYTTDITNGTRFRDSTSGYNNLQIWDNGDVSVRGKLTAFGGGGAILCSFRLIFAGGTANPTVAMLHNPLGVTPSAAYSSTGVFTVSISGYPYLGGIAVCQILGGTFKNVIFGSQCNSGYLIIWTSTAGNLYNPGNGDEVRVLVYSSS